MKFGLISAAAAAMLSVCASAQAATLLASYTEQNASVPNGDFGVCCSSPPATLEVIALGSGLTNGGPTLSAGSTVVDQSGGELLWWTPGQGGITATGTGTFKLDQTTNMYPPNSTGGNDSAAYEGAVLTGTLVGTGHDVQITVASDDDSLVYVDGEYVGGVPGVHPTTGTTINLGDLTGDNSLEIFYTDRAPVGANLFVNVTGAGVAVPEPATWALMILGVGMIGFAARRRGQPAIAAV
jgi:hypothetical protein